jgi:hypothetical protein
MTKQRLIIMTLLETLSKAFPSTAKAPNAITGWIPMNVFEVVEKELRKEFCGRYRVVYRGPRAKKTTASTLRGDATHAVVYLRQSWVY